KEMSLGKQQRLVLVVTILASFVSFLDGSIVNVALPAIQHDLGGGLSAQQWVVDAYLLTLGSFILIAGSLSDLLGRKRILTLGLLGFGAASLLCAVAPSSTALIIFRALQGVAGALLVPSSLAIIISTFSGAAQGKAIGTWTAWTGIAFVIGPLLGGFLVDSVSWRLIFAINVVPITATLYLLRYVTVAKDQTKKATVDIIGAALCALGLGGPVFALIEQPRYGWGDPLIYLPLGVGAIIFITFLLYESRTKAPMLKLGLFRNHNFSVGNVATLAIYAGLSVSTFLIVLFLQQVSHYSALKAGLAMLPVTIIMFLLSPRAGALAGRYGPRFFMGVGPLIGGIGFLLVARLPLDFNYWTQLLPGIIVFGVGLSITVAPLTAAILGDVPEGDAGIASAVNNAVARVAGLVAVAAVGAIVALQFGNALSKDLCIPVSSSALQQAKQASLVTTPPKPYQNNASFKAALNSASVSGFHAGMNVTAGLVIAGGIISLIGIRNPKR
ncbi:MAG TPA: MFS transporter, partial [Candidatus Saccharimonadales bacterium]|nr:MFS transporter [Candidatus Saccharimonadales bacterium]